MCVCTCTCHTGALHITCTCNKHTVLLLSRYSVKDPGQRSRIEEEFVARSKCIQSHYMYVTLPFTSMLIAAKPYKSTIDPSPHLYLCWWQPNCTRACTDKMHALGPALRLTAMAVVIDIVYVWSPKGWFITIILWCLRYVKIFINSRFLVTRCKNAMQRNARIGSESILAFRCIVVSINTSTTQHNVGSCVVLWTGLKLWLQMYTTSPCYELTKL